MGAGKKTKGRASRRQGKQAPRRVPARQGQQATTPLRPPLGTATLPPPRPARGEAPLRVPLSTKKAGAARVQPRGCKGRSPLHKKTMIPPLPAGKGVGGMGAETKLKQKAGGRQRRQAPRRHLLFLPRGRGPSQTPKFLSPGPPSPWLPALFTRAASQLPRSRRVSERYPHPAPQEAKPPLGTAFHKKNRCRPGSAPGDARGAAPCIRKL